MIHCRCGIAQTRFLVLLPQLRKSLRDGKRSLLSLLLLLQWGWDRPAGYSICSADEWGRTSRPAEPLPPHLDPLLLQRCARSYFLGGARIDRCRGWRRTKTTTVLCPL